MSMNCDTSLSATRLLAPRMVPEGGSPALFRGFKLNFNSNLARVPPDHLQQMYSPEYAGSTPSHLRVQTDAQKGISGLKILTSFLQAASATTLQAECSGSVRGVTTSATMPGTSLPLVCCGSGVGHPKSATTPLMPLPVGCCGSGVDHPTSATTSGMPVPLRCCGSELVPPPWAPGAWPSVEYLGPSDGTLVGGWCSEVCPLEHHPGYPN